MWLQVEGKDGRLEKKRVDLEDREEALEGQISKAAYLVLSLIAIKAGYRLFQTAIPTHPSFIPKCSLTSSTPASSPPL